MKIGRNDKCPCGSDKKYKKCCLNKPITTSNQNSEIQALIKHSQELRVMIDEIMSKSYKVNDDKEVFSAFCLGKAYKTHGAILLLCKNGYGQDAGILVRSLFDMLVTLLYILKDESNERLARYLNYDWVERKNSFKYGKTKPAILKELKIRSGNEEEYEKLILEIETKGKEVEQKYKYKGNWSDKSIRDMADEVGRLGLYLTVFKLTSQFAHTSPRTMNDYIKKGHTGPVIAVHQDNTGVNDALVAGFDCLFGITARHIDLLKLDYIERLKQVENGFIEAVHKINSK